MTHRNTGLLRHKVDSFTPTSAADSKFTLKDGRTLSVADYFRQGGRVGHGKKGGREGEC